MAPLIVDDTAIVDDRGDVFDLDDDFDAPDGSRYVSDIHNVSAKPQKRVGVRPRRRRVRACRSPWAGVPAGQRARSCGCRALAGCAKIMP